MTDTFRCGHPQTPENSAGPWLARNGQRYSRCALCSRISTSVAAIDRQLARWKHGNQRQTLGQQIAEGKV